MEHFYAGILGNSVNILELYKRMVDEAPADRPSTFVELGAWKGRSAAFMAVEIVNSGKPIEFHVVDLWDDAGFLRSLPSHAYEPATYAEFLANMDPVLRERDYLERVHVRSYSGVQSITLHRCSTVEAAKWMAKGVVDFVFIDADHRYEGCKADIKAWLPKVKPGGILAGHDYADEYHGVKQAVDEAFGDRIGTEGVTWKVRI